MAACALLGGLGWLLGGYRLLSILVFCGLLAGAAVYWYSDRMVLGLVGTADTGGEPATTVQAPGEEQGQPERSNRESGVTERGTGLRGLADRVEALGGRLRVWTPRGGGTRIRAELPCG